MVRKIYKKLSKEDIENGCIFSSCLSTERYELLNDTVHKVFKDDKDKDEHISRLKDDKFFNKSHFNYNIIRTA